MAVAVWGWEINNDFFLTTTLFNSPAATTKTYIRDELNMSIRDRFSKLLKEPFSKQVSHDVRDGMTNPGGPFPFLCLPKEIRDEIYMYVFGEEGVHLLDEGNRIAHIRCRGRDPHPKAEVCCPHVHDSRNTLIRWGQPRLAIDRLNLRDDDIPRSRMREMKDKFKSKYKRPSGDKPGLTPGVHQNNLVCQRYIPRTPTALFLVNREISNESLEMLYKKLTFQVESLELLICFRQQVSRHAFSVIRYLRASWIALACLTQAPVRPGRPGYPQYEYYTALSDDSYHTFWRVVARDMSGLVDLGFVMDYSGQYLSRSVDAEWHRPLANLGGLRRFDLQIWDKETGTAEAEADMGTLRNFLPATRTNSSEIPR